MMQFWKLIPRLADKTQKNSLCLFGQRLLLFRGRVSILHGLLFSGHHAQGALAQGQQLILAGINGDGSDEAEVLFQVLLGVGVVSNAAGQDNLIDLAMQDSGHSAGVLGDLVEEGIPDQLGLGVAFVGHLAHGTGIVGVQVTVETAVEVVNPKMPCTVDADELRKMNAEGKITGCVVDGPLSMDIAIDPEAAHHKGAQDRPAAGHADILLFPDIQAGNLVYKTLVHTADCKNGCILTGTKVPAILTSRSDSFQTKVNSIALAAVVAAGLAE